MCYLSCAFNPILHRYDKCTSAKVFGGTGGSWRIGSNALVTGHNGQRTAVRFCSFFAIPVDVPHGSAVLQFAHVRNWSERAAHPHVSNSSALQLYHFPPVGDRILVFDGSKTFQQLAMAPVMFKVPRLLASGLPSLRRFEHRIDPAAVFGMHSTSAAEALLQQLGPARLQQALHRLISDVPADWRDMVQQQQR